MKPLGVKMKRINRKTRLRLEQKLREARLYVPKKLHDYLDEDQKQLCDNFSHKDIVYCLSNRGFYTLCLGRFTRVIGNRLVAERWFNYDGYPTKHPQKVRVDINKCVDGYQMLIDIQKQYKTFYEIKYHRDYYKLMYCVDNFYSRYHIIARPHNTYNFDYERFKKA